MVIPAVRSSCSAPKRAFTNELRALSSKAFISAPHCPLCHLAYRADFKVGVSIKRNVGKHTSEPCYAGGYVTIKPRKGVERLKIRLGEYTRCVPNSKAFS